MNAMNECEKRERDRERKHRETCQGEFEASMLSLDHVPEDSEKYCSWFSDNGAGVEAIVNHCDRSATGSGGGCGSPEWMVSYYSLMETCARNRLRRSNRRLVEVFDLALEYGDRRRCDSIWQLLLRGRSPNWAAAKMRYWDHLKKILFFFKVQ